jgi:hypothetical protein
LSFTNSLFGVVISCMAKKPDRGNDRHIV